MLLSRAGENTARLFRRQRLTSWKCREPNVWSAMTAAVVALTTIGAATAFLTRRERQKETAVTCPLSPFVQQMPLPQKRQWDAMPCLSRMSHLLSSSTTTSSHVQCEGLPSQPQMTVEDGPSRWIVQDDESFYYERMIPPIRAETTSHVIFGQLLKPDLVERYHVYKRVHVDQPQKPRFEEVVVADVKLGSKVDGHEGIVHGGILALLLDDTMGFAFHAIHVPMAVTANLKIDYRKPVPSGASILIRVHLEKTEGRKLYFTAQITSLDGKTLHVEASSLYIIPRSPKRN